MNPAELQRPQRTNRLAVAVIVGVALVHAAIKLYGHFHFGTGFDSALYGNVSWRLANGFDDISSLTGFPYLPSHISGALFFFLPVFRWWPDWGLPVVFIAQAVSVGLVGWAVWTLSGYFELGRGIRWILLAGTLLSPGALLATRLEINEPTLMLGALAMTISAGLRAVPISRMWWWVILAASGRIEMAAATLVLGLLLLIGKRKAPGVLASVVGAAVLGATLTYLFAGGGEAPSVAAHFAHLGASPAEIVNTVLTRPVALIEPLGSYVMWISFVFWLLPFGLVIPLVGWRWLLPALPLAAVALLGVWPNADVFIHHYWFGFLVGGSMATIYALHRRSSLRPHYPVFGLAGLGAAWIMMAPVIGGLDLNGSAATPALRDMVNQVRVLPGEGLTVPLAAAPHLIGRPDLQFFPRPFGCADRQIGPYRPPDSLPRYVALAGLALDSSSTDTRFATVSALIVEHYELVGGPADFQLWELTTPASFECFPDPPEGG